jgi:hypothetical protein
MVKPDSVPSETSDKIFLGHLESQGRIEAKGGKDLFTKDGTVIAQSRLLAHYGQSWLNSQIQRHMKQMTRKLRVDFRYNRKAEVGYAVLSVLYVDEVKSLVAEIRPRTE